MSFDAEYVVVGSGAGGGTCAARLAEAGKRVLLLEAGGDPLELQGGDPVSPDTNRLPEDYQVPVFHPIASENQAMHWPFFVRHYADQAQQKRDEKYRADYNGVPVDGVLYPRAGTLGGCTAHNAQIMVYPSNSDWDGIAKDTGDSSWNSDNMRKIFMKMENCEYRWPYRLAAMFGFNPTRHGFGGWLQTEKAIPLTALGDKDLVAVILESAAKAFEELGDPLQSAQWNLQSQGDPNDWRCVESNAFGLRYPPLSTRGHKRMGARERVIETARRHPEFLRIETDALATRVMFDDANKAIGVEYLKGRSLYRPYGPASQGGERREARASKEVILAGGAFNTPQLLMLSGIGPQAVLNQFGIPVRVNLPGVGKNLQDRYEVGVVNEMNFPVWEVLKGARFAKDDPQYQQWLQGQGVYTTNGAVLAVIKRSLKERPIPDLFCFALLGLFKGYFPGYSALFPQHLNYLTWAILKAHTLNRGGDVTIKSADPRVAPSINFHYFDEGTDPGGQDLDSVVAGVKFVRSMTKDLKAQKLILKEHLPGDAVQTDAEIKQFVRDNAWGHHASCTCPIGDVLDSKLQVKGVQGLRVADASVFPRIPGMFIVSAVYMVGEKAAQTILT